MGATTLGTNLKALTKVTLDRANAWRQECIKRQQQEAGERVEASRRLARWAPRLMATIAEATMRKVGLPIPKGLQSMPRSGSEGSLLAEAAAGPGRPVQGGLSGEGYVADRSGRAVIWSLRMYEEEDALPAVWCWHCRDIPRVCGFTH